MRLKTHIFLWVFVATVLPLTLLVLAAVTYTENRYESELAQDISSRLNSLVSELERTLYYERQLVRALASAPDMRAYFPVLARAADGDLHPEFFSRAEKLNQFLVGFQGVVPTFNSLRVLDAAGNTMIKVRNGVATVGAFDGIESFPYAEPELDDPHLLEQLRALPLNDIGFVTLPESRWELEALRPPALLNAVVPLVQDRRTLGYLVADFSGEQVDRILELAPRTSQGDLLIAEINPDHPDRDGLILYDDLRDLRFSRYDNPPRNLRSLDRAELWEALIRRPYGDVISEDGRTRTYYLEYLPYSSQLTSWLVAVRIDMSEMLAPFQRIRQGIALFAAVALLLSLFLVGIGARRVAGPITRMAHGLKQYADGNHSVRIQASGADEIRQLETSFNYMADTLERAEQERNRAQHLIMQSAKLASVGEMAAGIGHELNNPLNNILSLAKLIERSLPESEERARRDVHSLREEALRASRIINGILNFARQVPPHFSRFAVAPWIDETLLLVRQMAREKHVHLESGVDDEYELVGDRGQLQQVMVNLLLNAIQASPEGGRVRVHATRRDGNLVLTVSDEGIGIGADIMERIFDPFFSMKAVGEGSGLGLSISLGIVERHRGRIGIVNNKTVGVTASVELPETQPLDDRKPDAAG